MSTKLLVFRLGPSWQCEYPSPQRIHRPRLAGRREAPTSSRHLWPQRSGGASSAQARKRGGRSRIAFVVVDFPDDDEVLAHGFRFRPARWTPLVSDGWGGFLEQLPA